MAFSGRAFPKGTVDGSAGLRWSVAKKLSQAERDRRRRERGKGDSKTMRYIAVGTVLVVVLVVVAFVLAGDDGVETGDSRAQNVAAFGLADDPFKGDESADVVVVAFEAPRCSSCRAFHFTTLPELQEEFFDTGQAVFYYVQYRISPEDLDMGIMQECALREAGNAGFWDLTDRVYSLPEYPSVGRAEQAFQEWGDQAGVRDEAWSCYQDRDTSSKVSADWRIGDEVGVPGTPTFYVFGPQGEPVQANAPDLRRTIADLAAQA